MIDLMRNTIKTERFQTTTLLTLAALIVAMLFVIALQNGAKPPPFAYTEAPAFIGPPEVCAGDELRYRSVAQTRLSHGERVVVATIRTVWSVERERTEIPALLGDVRIVTWRESVDIVGGASYPLPADIPPGPYELRISAILFGQNSVPVGADLPFVVKPC